MAPLLSKQIHILTIIFLTFFIITQSTFALKNSTNDANYKLNLLELKSLCKTTPYPNVCLNSLQLTISINIPPNLLNFIIDTLENAINEVTKLSLIFKTTTKYNLVENQKGTMQDCKELHQITLNVLKKSLSRVRSSKISDARAFLSATLTNKDTCLEGLASASGSAKSTLVNSIVDSYKHGSNSLSMLPNPSQAPHKTSNHGRRLLEGLPRWLDSKSRKILQTDDYSSDTDSSMTLIVAQDGSGNFTSIQEAVNYAPNNSEYRTFIYIRQGAYMENVEVPSYKNNIVMIGDGRDNTLISGSRSMGSGWTTFSSATLGNF